MFGLARRAALQRHFLLAVVGATIATHVVAGGPFGFFVREEETPPPPSANCPPTMGWLAEQLTCLESDLRQYGTITLKEPDVWGDANLMFFIQEYEAQMKTNVGKFEETLQGFVSLSDSAVASSQTALGMGLSGTAPPTSQLTSTVNAAPIDITDLAAYEALSKAIAAAPPKVGKISLEPTELVRQNSIYLRVLQSLRRTNMGDDNSRAAGYGLYLFRFPVSVLPGRVTYKGHSAMVTLRAQLEIDPNHLRYTFPRLAVAELVEELTPLIGNELNWGRMFSDDQKMACDQKQGPGKSGARTSPTALSAVGLLGALQFYGADGLNAVRCLSKGQFDAGPPPRPEDLRSFLFDYLMQIHLMLEKRQAYEENFGNIQCAVRAIQSGDFELLASYRDDFQFNVQAGTPGENHDLKLIASMVALQMGLLNENVQEQVRALIRTGEFSGLDESALESVVFYDCNSCNSTCPLAQQIWAELIRVRFPIHVFALDPVVEEQNIYDAFSRRREMQFALAFAAASGEINFNQALKFSRQLALDQATIDLNRVIVGFAHGNDTFGWYFHPRLQSPPAESSNLAALARTIWSTGPTRCYDLKHRELEAGIRECEALVVMPSFVPGVRFDVTTNWESLVTPGCVTRDYRSMIEQGARIRCLLQSAPQVCDQDRYRPEDYAVLFSRAEQLDKMLPLQTSLVRIPFSYQLSGTELFDTGNKFLRPRLDGFYGLSFLSTADDAELFVTGRHFHPTLTRVIAAGKEAVYPTDVTVMSRELLKIKLGKVAKALTDDPVELRVATPAGVSTPLEIPLKSAPPAAPLYLDPKLIDVGIACDTSSRSSLLSFKFLPQIVFLKAKEAQKVDGEVQVTLKARDVVSPPFAITVGQHASIEEAAKNLLSALHAKGHIDLFVNGSIAVEVSAAKPDKTKLGVDELTLRWCSAGCPVGELGPSSVDLNVPTEIVELPEPLPPVVTNETVEPTGPRIVPGSLRSSRRIAGPPRPR